MPKFFKIIALIISALVLLVIAAMLAVLLLVDPNDYKDEITDAVQQATGRNLTLKGDLKLSLFPWLGLSMGEASLGNAPGFGDQPMASVSAVDIKVKLLPLLSKRVEMNIVRLHGLRVQLQRAADGNTNWQDLLASQQPAPGKAPTQVAPAPGPGLAAFAIGGVELLDARFEWDDRQTGQRAVVDKLNLRTSKLAPPLPVEVSLSTDFSLTQPALKNHVDFGARVTADLAKGTLDMDQIQLQIAGLVLKGDIHVANLDTTPKLTAQLDLAAFSPRTLAMTLGATLPKTADASVLNRASASLRLEASADRAALSQLTVTLDDSTLRGTADISHFDQPAVRFDLALDDLDADRYLAPPAPTAAPSTPAPSEPAELPLEMLRALDVDGRFVVGKLKIAKARLSDIQLHLLAKNGQIRLHPASAALYDGKYNGDIGVDVRGATPKLALEATLADVQAGPLLKDMLGNDVVLGVGNVQAKITAQGSDPNAIIKTLDGTARINFANGAVKGVNIGQLLREAYAKLKKLPAPPKSEEQTDFVAVSASVAIDNGVVNNRDLKADAPAMRVSGEGKVDLPQQRIDYRLTTTLIDSLTGQDSDEAAELKGIPIPIKISGSFDKPKFALDLKPLLEAKAKEELAHQKKKLKNEVDKKLEEEKDKAKDKLEQKLKDKLKGLF